jgi:hypothetical protein
VFAPQVIQGRWLGVEDLEALRRLIAEHPRWSRRRLSIALCEALNWRTASGQLKDMSARLLLNKLAERAGSSSYRRGSAVADVGFCVRSLSPNSFL